MHTRSIIASVVGLVVLSGAGLASRGAQRSREAAVTAVSQIPPPATQLETLLTRPNTLVTQDVYRVTTDGLASSFGLVIDAIVVNTLPVSAAHLQGLRVEVSEAGPPARSRISYVDGGELAGLSQALSLMASQAAQWTAREDTRASEAHFATSGGFVIGFRESNRNQIGYVEAGLVDPTHRTCTLQEFSVIKAAVDDAIALLRSK